MSNGNGLKEKIFDIIGSLIEGSDASISDDTALIGGSSVLDSSKLVELCLLLEDLAGDEGFNFDWTSEVAMSKSRSMFRTAGALAEEFLSQKEGQK